jgi:hypothetical protein
VTVNVDSSEFETHLTMPVEKFEPICQTSGTFNAAHAPQQRKKTGLRQL